MTVHENEMTEEGWEIGQGESSLDAAIKVEGGATILPLIDGDRR